MIAIADAARPAFFVALNQAADKPFPSCFARITTPPGKVHWPLTCTPQTWQAGSHSIFAVSTAHLTVSYELFTNIFASVGGMQPDRQEFTVKGSKASIKVAEFYKDSISIGDTFIPLREEPEDPRAVSLKAQLDNLVLKLNRKSNTLATIDEAFRVQILVEEILSKTWLVKICSK